MPIITTLLTASIFIICMLTNSNDVLCSSQCSICMLFECLFYLAHFFQSNSARSCRQETANTESNQRTIYYVFLLTSIRKVQTPCLVFISPPSLSIGLTVTISPVGVMLKKEEQSPAMGQVIIVDILLVFILLTLKPHLYT